MKDRLTFCGVVFMFGLHCGMVLGATGHAQDVPTALTWMVLEAGVAFVLILRFQRS